MDYIVDPQHLNLIRKRIQDEARLKVEYEQKLSRGELNADTARNMFNSISDVSNMDDFDVRILRELLTGDPHGVLPSELVKQKVHADTITVSDVYVDSSAVTNKIVRNDFGTIMSQEDNNGANKNWLAIPMVTPRVRDSRFRYLFNTRFEEFQTDLINSNVNDVRQYESQIEEMKSKIAYMEALNEAYKNDNTLVTAQRDALQTSLNAAYDSLNTLTNDFTNANNALADDVKKNADSTKDLANTISSAISSAGDKVDQAKQEIRGDVSKLDTRVSGVESSVSRLSNDVSTINTEVQTLKNANGSKPPANSNNTTAVTDTKASK